MRKIDEEKKQQVLTLLQSNRSQKEINTRTGVAIGTIEDWASDWRKNGLLPDYKRKGMIATRQAKLASNGYYNSIRKRFASMKWTDQLEKREFGFENSLKAIHYYLDSNKNPRVCAYCGKKPEGNKVWGLDRLDSTLGHIPGNLVPCCSNNEESRLLSCQTSKSKFDLYHWMETSMSRAYGEPIAKEIVLKRLEKIHNLAIELKNTVTN